jgi:hypothetical protein
MRPSVREKYSTVSAPTALPRSPKGPETTKATRRRTIRGAQRKTFFCRRFALMSADYKGTKPETMEQFLESARPSSPTGRHSSPNLRVGCPCGGNPPEAGVRRKTKPHIHLVLLSYFLVLPKTALVAAGANSQNLQYGLPQKPGISLKLGLERR